MPHKNIKANLSALIAADTVAKLLPLLTFPYITRVLGVEAYGMYGFAMSIIGFVMLFASPGFTTFGTRAVAQDHRRAKELASRITGTRLVFGVTALLALWVYAFTIAPSDATTRTLILIGSLLLITNAISLDWLLTGMSTVRPVALSNIASQLIYTSGIFLLLSSPGDVWVIPVAVLVGAAAGTAYVYYWVSHRIGLAWPTVSLRGFREIVPASLLLGFASLMSMTYDKIDAIMLGYFKTMEEVGLYTATYKLMWMVMSFLPILSAVFFPLIARGSSTDAREADAESGLYLRLLFLFSMPIIVGGMLLAEPLTALVIGRQFAGAGTLFALLLPNVLFGGLAIYYAGMRLVALHRNREYLLAVSTGAALNVAMNFVAIPFWGSIGAAITTCVSQAAVAGVAAWFGRRAPGPPLTADARVPLGASLIMLIALELIMRLVPNLHVVILVALGASTYGLAWKVARMRGWA